MTVCGWMSLAGGWPGAISGRVPGCARWRWIWPGGEEPVISAVAYEDESLELEVVLAGDRFREPVTIDRDGTGRGCQMSWERWADIEDDAAMEKATQMIASVVVSCAASR